MKITMLGTGNALVTECYNTCFVLSEGDRHFLVDGGGGNTVLRQLKRAGIDWKSIKDIFVTHGHVDHLLGIIWMVRMICQYMRQGEYEGEANIYAHEELISLLNGTAHSLLPEKDTRFIGRRLHLIPVADGGERQVIGRKTVFFDIHSAKAKQFGFTVSLGNGERLTCCGDEPYSEYERSYAEKSKWLLHEAFCLHTQADIFHPYEKSHSTVKDAAITAERLGVKNLLLYHTEDKNIADRKSLYLAEGHEYFNGNIFVPDDLETIEL